MITLRFHSKVSGRISRGQAPNAVRPGGRFAKLSGVSCFALVVTILIAITDHAAWSQTTSTTAQSSDVNSANNPLTPKITVNLQDYFIPFLNRTGERSANDFLLRGLVPAKFFGVPQIVRFTLPTVTSPEFPQGSNTGLGDLTLFDLIIIPTKSVVLGIGPLLVVPTATDDLSGTGKWQAGVAGVAVMPQKWGLLASLVTYQHSFAGEDNRPTTQILNVQPIITVNLPQSFYARSSGQWTFDFGNHTTVVPVGLGIGKVWALANGTTINAFAEPQYSLFRSGVGVPDWQVFAGVNFQFPIGGS
jgi:hypothetical protein